MNTALFLLNGLAAAVFGTSAVAAFAKETTWDIAVVGVLFPSLFAVNTWRFWRAYAAEDEP